MDIVDPIVEYHVTGVDVRGKRFKLVYGPTYFLHVDMINLHHGSVWGVKANGKRTLLKRVTP